MLARHNDTSAEYLLTVAPGLPGIQERLFDQAPSVRVAAVKALPWNRDLLHELEQLDQNSRVRRLIESE